MLSTDPTFRFYSTGQAQTYAVERRSYSNELYDIVLNYHTSTGGKLNRLLDVGCGPGNATRDLSVVFDSAIGVDPSSKMIATARSRGGKTRFGDDIKFEVSLAEECSKIDEIGSETVDLLTAAMAVSQFSTECNDIVPLIWLGSLVRHECVLG